LALNLSDFLDQLPVAAVQMLKNSLPLGFKAEAGSALLLSADAAVGDVFAVRAPMCLPYRFYATVDGRVIVSRSTQPLLEDCSGCLTGHPR